MKIQFIPQREFVRVERGGLADVDKLSLLAAMCRGNALCAVKRAGSGHLGSSFSAMDIVVWLYFRRMNLDQVGLSSPDRDVYFSSKGHDVPGFYSVAYAKGFLPEDRFLRLRRLGGVDGHPDVRVPGVEANSGSLGMGISKGRGIAWAKRRLGLAGHVFVMTGDGEFQEGQNFEGLQAAVQQGAPNLTVIMDHNKVQSDKPVAEIVGLGNLEGKLSAFGWDVVRIDGHDFEALASVLWNTEPGPRFVIADTIKGRGVSFMEHPVALEAGGGLYPWHAGAPDDETFARAYEEIMGTVRAGFEKARLGAVETFSPPSPEQRVGSSVAVRDSFGEPVSLALRERMETGVTHEYVAEAFGDALLDLADDHPELIVLDADLAADCRIRRFEKAYPERFIQNGIAEQDMVSMAGGLARHGMLPVVNSFAAFLASRANEQIYNNNTEGSRIIYAFHYAGLIPAGPGKSHQSLRDISLVGALPNCVVVQPGNAAETKKAVSYAVSEATENVVLRLIIGPSPRRLDLPSGYEFSPGRGVALTEGENAVLFAYGPVMLHEALLAAEILAENSFGLKVVNMPWLNRVDGSWLREELGSSCLVSVMEDHAPVGGLGDFLLSEMVSMGTLANRRFQRLAVEGHPACGTPLEVLRAHGLDGESVARRILAEASAPQRRSRQ
ncbi:MAG: transketolase C-terminal domain-containing protein [Longimicrobiales bacterium]